MPAVQQKKAAVLADPLAKATKATIVVHGREYHVACGEGESDRLDEIVQFVNNKLEQIADHNDSASESRLLLLTCLTLADELLELRKTAVETRAADEDLFVAAVEHLSDRVAQIALQIGRA